MPFQTIPYTRLTYGVNLRGLTGGINMRPGEAQDALDVLPREDGAIYRTPGWVRVNDSALTGRPIGAYGFTYHGKNTPSGDTARGGNFAQANAGADFTRRTDEFSAFVILTTSTFYRWNPSTQAFASVSLPSGVSVDVVKPVMKAVKNNLYIVGWTDYNIRYDPTDHAIYRWGWDSAPSAPSLGAQASGDLIVGGVYKYAYSWLDLYTGEESAMSASTSATIAGSNRTIRVTVGAYADSPARHFNTLLDATDSDVGVVIYRTFADDDTFYFLTTLNPGTVTYDDASNAGVATGTELKPFRVYAGAVEVDEPRFTALEEFRGRFYALSRFANGNRCYFSDLTFYERFRVRNYIDLPVTEGDALTAIGRTDTTPIIHSRRGGFRMTVNETGSARPQLIPTNLPWEAGAVGPRAREMRNGWEYWLSERGPMRWMEGLGAPQWIGKPLAPMFVDATSGLCKLNERARELTELCFDWTSNTMRFLFTIGEDTYPNQHWAYWIDAEKYNADPESGWFPQSPRAQTMDQSHSLTKLDGVGKPVSAQDRIERLVFGDDQGYIYEYELWSRRGGLKPGALAKGFVDASSTTTVVNVKNSVVFAVGDGMKGMRCEIVYADGTRHARKILSNTATAITLTTALPSAPAENDVFYVGGMPAFWRSWVDIMGDSHAHKSVLHLYVGLVRMAQDPTDDFSDWRADIEVGVGEFPQTLAVAKTATLDLYRRKILVARTGVHFVYEISNTRPDEGFVVTNVTPEAEMIPVKRRA